MIATDYREGVLFPSATTLLHPDRRGAQGVACRRDISALITQSIALHYCRPRLGMAGVARVVGSFTGGRLGGWRWRDWKSRLHMHTLPCGYQNGINSHDNGNKHEHAIALCSGASWSGRRAFRAGAVKKWITNHDAKTTIRPSRNGQFGTLSPTSLHLRLHQAVILLLISFLYRR